MTFQSRHCIILIFTRGNNLTTSQMSQVVAISTSERSQYYNITNVRKLSHNQPPVYGNLSKTASMPDCQMLEGIRVRAMPCRVLLHLHHPQLIINVIEFQTLDRRRIEKKRKIIYFCSSCLRKYSDCALGALRE